MEDLLLHPLSRHHLQDFDVRPSHALLLLGPSGAGKKTVAKALATKLLGLNDQQALSRYSQLHYLAPQSGVISIEQIRELHSKLILKASGHTDVKRVIVIVDGGSMTREAQNALLKNLEEPPTGTVFMLSAHSRNDLMATVRSRCRIIVIKTPAKDQVKNYFMKRGFDNAAIDKAYYLSGGQVGLLAALLTHAYDHPLMQMLEEAKRLLNASLFERLTAIESLTKQKDAWPQLLDATQRIAMSALRQAGQRQQIVRLHRILKAIEAARMAILRNAGGKLWLTDLFLNL